MARHGLSGRNASITPRALPESCGPGTLCGRPALAPQAAATARRRRRLLRPASNARSLAASQMISRPVFRSSMTTLGTLAVLGVLNRFEVRHEAGNGVLEIILIAHAPNLPEHRNHGRPGVQLDPVGRVRAVSLGRLGGRNRVSVVGKDFCHVRCPWLMHPTQVRQAGSAFATIVSVIARLLTGCVVACPRPSSNRRLGALNCKPI